MTCKYDPPAEEPYLSAYRLGYQAAFDGLDINSNPYKDSWVDGLPSVEYESMYQWDVGFSCADEQINYAKYRDDEIEYLNKENIVLIERVRVLENENEILKKSIQIVG